mmetsp:Transcript_35494/g.42372  ORF Transcript_35494/g.42372 Transcript_35494/m.42372 type:complete len:94 (+) Transcript_35494:66-347(+)
MIKPIIILFITALSLVSAEDPAISCNAFTMENCNDQEKAFIDIADEHHGHYADVIGGRITMIKNGKGGDSDWSLRRIHILEQFLAAALEKDEL